MISSSSKSRQQLRQEKRLEIKMEKIEATVADQINVLLNDALSENELNEIALNTKFLVRERELKPFAMVAILLMGCFNGAEEVSTLETMCCYLGKWFDTHMKPQSLQEQINCKECADFIKKVAFKIMMHESNKIVAKLLKRSKKIKSSLFRRILLQDSSVISLPETVSKIFKGCGGGSSKSAAKWDMIIDQTNHLILRCRCLSGKTPDASLSKDIFSFAEEGDLVIRDMGYFNLSHFTLFNKKNIWFISRLKSDVYVYLNKTDEQPINIIEYLESLNLKKKKIDIDVYIGKKERIPLRLIGLKVPKEVIDTRKAQYKKARGNSKNPSENLLIWYGYTLMITNIPKEKMPLLLILKMYKIRWQIELFFKNMKSHLKVDNFTGQNKYRILCLLYTKLTLTWISALLYLLVQMKTNQKYTVSPFKFTKWLHNLGDWQNSVAKGDFTKLIADFERDQHLLRKQVKNKKVSLNTS
jgi:hypothetical protein